MSDEARRRFNELVAPHLDDAYRLARWLTGGAQNAEDIVQDAALRAYRGLSGLREVGSSRAWFFTIVRNAAASARADGMYTELWSAEAETSREPTPEDAAIAAGDAALVRRAIAQLPEEFREAIVLREIAGLSYREIAQMTRAPIGTVMSRLSRARRLLGAAVLAEGGSK